MNRAFFCLLFLASCVAPSYDGYHPKCAWDAMPKVVLIPVFDCSNHPLFWNVSSELTDLIRSNLLNDNGVFLYDEDRTFEKVLETRHVSLEETQRRIKYYFGKASFVVLVDLLQHDMIPYERYFQPECEKKPHGYCSGTLMQKARLTILDVRERTPCVLLQEIINCNQYIPKEFEFFSYQRSFPGLVCYEDSPAGKAHYRLANVIATRIENVVWSAF
jgi:hypothetical protein